MPRNAPYLVVYPFVKTRPWYFLPFEERVAAISQHAETGEKFVTVTNHTTYSFGIDDQEFMPGLRVRGAVRLHAPDADAARDRSLALDGA